MVELVAPLPLQPESGGGSGGSGGRQGWVVATERSGVGTPAVTRRGQLQWRTSAAAAVQESLTLGKRAPSFARPA